jgi:hypothetical protein
MPTEILNRETTEEGEKIEGYRPICGLAVGGAAVGALSLMAYVHSSFWMVPFVGTLMSGLALWRIAASGGVLAGRWAALAGLTCSLLFGSTAVAHSLLKPTRVHGEAQRFVANWFAALRDGDGPQAHQHSVVDWNREPAGNLARRYDESPKLERMLAAYVKQEPVRTLLALGERAQVRFVRNERLEVGVDEHHVEDIYQVSVNGDVQEGARLLKVELRDAQNLLTRQWGWDVKSAQWLESPPDEWNEPR